MGIATTARRAAARVLNDLLGRYYVRSYAQEGEDILLARIIGPRPTGFYVDVGAHHPQRFSNTCLFYRRGWSGINIEPNPDAAALFRKWRSRDTNLQMGIAESRTSLKYHYFSDPALNTFDASVARDRIGNTPYTVLRTEEIPVVPLSNVLDQHLAPSQSIDFLTIDTEGLDLAVLRSNDWQRYRPRLVLAESLGSNLTDVLDSELVQFMCRQQYTPLAKTLNTLVFRCEG